MSTCARIPDWPTLDATARRKLSLTAAKRARRLEPRLNAFVSIEDRLPGVDGKLGGLPYAAKDIFRTASRRPTGGLATPTDVAVDGETDLLARLDDAGARCVGFTALTELAYEPSGYNHARGRVRNPWNCYFVAGGSSSGSAAAVASGSVVVALGSDTAGSLRIPAHCCGVTAWKPTHGLVPCAGAMPLAPSLDTIGLLARSACDMREAVDILIGDDRPRTDGSVERVAAIADCFDAAEPLVAARACKVSIRSRRAARVSNAAHRWRKSRQSAAMRSSFYKRKRRAFIARASRTPIFPHSCASVWRKGLPSTMRRLPQVYQRARRWRAS